MSGCNSRQPHQFSILLSRAPARAAEPPNLSMPGAAPGRLANFQWGRGRQVMHLPCKQAYMGAVPIDSTNLRSVELRLGRPFHCGENEIQASLISSASVGATPTPATNLGRCSGCSTVNRASQNMCRKRRTGALPAPPTISGSVAQLAEQPVVCGKAEGANPFGSAILSERSSVFRAPGLGPGGRR